MCDSVYLIYLCLFIPNILFLPNHVWLVKYLLSMIELPFKFVTMLDFKFFTYLF